MVKICLITLFCFKTAAPTPAPFIKFKSSLVVNCRNFLAACWAGNKIQTKALNSLRSHSDRKRAVGAARRRANVTKLEMAQQTEEERSIFNMLRSPAKDIQGIYSLPEFLNKLLGTSSIIARHLSQATTGVDDGGVGFDNNWDVLRFI